MSLDTQLSLFTGTERTLAETPVRAPMHAAAVLDNIRAIVKAHRRGTFGVGDHEVFPTIDKSGKPWRLYFTLPCAINYQRKSENLWLAAKRTFEDPATTFVFQCESTARGFDAFRRALAVHRLAALPERQASIWFTLATTFQTQFAGDPANLIRSFNGDVERIKSFVLANKKAFPYLSGPKLLNYWLYIYSYFVPNANLTNRQAITVIPDVHVKRASVALGLIDAGDADNTELVADKWAVLLKGTEFAPCDLHAPLWRWSRAGLPDVRSV